MNKLNKFLQECKKQNKLIVEKKLSIQTFSNVSIRIDKDHFTIKPSGVLPHKIKDKDCPIIRIKDGKKINGKYNPSTDTPTHRILYKKFFNLKSISHTHSKFATAWAQTAKSIPNYGTTHSDYWTSEIPVTKYIKKSDLKKYEENTGNLIVDNIIKRKLTTENCPGIIVAGHGSFCWGDNFDSAVKYSEMLEFIAELALYCELIKVKKKLPNYLSQKHFDRKFGKRKYYGQIK